MHIRLLPGLCGGQYCEWEDDMPGVLLQYSRRRGMALKVGLKKHEMPRWDKLCRAQIAPSNRRMLPAASAVHTCELVFKKPHGVEQKEHSETPQILVCQ